jgi:hypothetical protein
MYRQKCIYKLTSSCISTFLMLLVCSCGTIVNAQSNSGKKKNWSGITVQVYANQNVQSYTVVTDTKGGKSYLDITLSNKSNQVAVIDSIEVKIPVIGNVNTQSQVAYGSSSMGSRQVLVQQLGKSTKYSYSYMYAMLRQSSNQYVCAAALSWRTFLPIISFNNNSFIIRSKCQSKPCLLYTSPSPRDV